MERSNGKLIGSSSREPMSTTGAGRLLAVGLQQGTMRSAAEVLEQESWPADIYYKGGTISAGFEIETQIYAGDFALDWLLVVGQDIACSNSQIWVSESGRCQPCPGTTPCIINLSRICFFLLPSAPNYRSTVATCVCPTP